jgi:hypothetical protein
MEVDTSEDALDSIQQGRGGQIEKYQLKASLSRVLHDR